MSSTKLTRQRVMLVRSTGFSQAAIDDIKTTYPSGDFVVVDDNRESIYGSLKGLTGLVGCPRPLVTPELVKLASPTIRWIHSTGAGCEGFFFQELVESSITLTNGKIIQGPEVADHAFALMLSLTRNLCFYQSGRMPASLPRPIELWGKTAVVIGGGGGIGLLIGERAAAFGMDVVVVDTELAHMTSFIRRQFYVD
jgi:phosphoglycerate dehydrogenase-like enzyme